MDFLIANKMNLIFFQKQIQTSFFQFLRTVWICRSCYSPISAYRICDSIHDCGNATKELTTDMSPYYLGTYFTFIIGFSFLMNVLMVSGLIPVVGLPLPFSLRRSSLLCFSIMLGLIFSSRIFKG